MMFASLIGRPNAAQYIFLFIDFALYFYVIIFVFDLRVHCVASDRPVKFFQYVIGRFPVKAVEE